MPSGQHISAMLRVDLSRFCAAPSARFPLWTCRGLCHSFGRRNVGRILQSDRLMSGIFRRARKIDETETRAKIVDRMMEQGRKLFSRSDLPQKVEQEELDIERARE